MWAGLTDGVPGKIGPMEIEDHLAQLELDGVSLASAAQRTGLDAAVPTCPGWRVRDLLVHLGYVHRWATTQVAEARQSMRDGHGEDEVLAGGPDDETLLGWFLEGHAALVATLRGADPELSCWTFLPAPSPLAFWARRQAHETAVHRADVELAGGAIDPVEPRFAADGIDELVMGFAPTGRSRIRIDRRRVLALRAVETGDEWVIGLGPDRVDTARGAGTGDCRLEGAASDLYLLLWNRLALAGTDIALDGEDDLVGLWAETLRVRWS